MRKEETGGQEGRGEGRKGGKWMRKAGREKERVWDEERRKGRRGWLKVREEMVGRKGRE